MILVFFPSCTVAFHLILFTFKRIFLSVAMRNTIRVFLVLVTINTLPDTTDANYSFLHTVRSSNRII